MRKIGSGTSFLICLIIATLILYSIFVWYPNYKVQVHTSPKDEYHLIEFNYTADELKNMTTLQRDQFIGKDIMVTGTVTDVWKYGDRISDNIISFLGKDLYVIAFTADDINYKIIVSSKYITKDQALTIKKGDTITVKGEIKRISTDILGVEFDKPTIRLQKPIIVPK